MIKSTIKILIQVLLLLVPTVCFSQGTVRRVSNSGSSYNNYEIQKAQLPFLEKDGKVIIDKTNGLMWTFDDYMSLNGNSLKNASWNEAVRWKDDMNAVKYGGFSDWRLPTIKELVTIYRPKERREMAKQYFAPTNAYAFWSSNASSKYVRSYLMPDDGAATSGAMEGQKDYTTNLLFDFSVRLVRSCGK